MRKRILQIIFVFIIIILLICSTSTISLASDTNIDSALEYNTEIQKDIVTEDGIISSLEQLEEQVENKNLEQTKQDIINTENNLINQNEQLINIQSLITNIEEIKSIENLEEKYNKLNETYQQTLKEVELANEELANAKENMNQAQVNFNLVQADMDNTIKQNEEYVSNLEQLQKIQEQYYDLMVFYYRAYLGYGKNDVIYNEDGSVDLEASAQKMIDTNKVSQASTNVKKEIVPLGRYVTKLLVNYIISNEENIDKSSIQFGQDNNPNEVMQSGVLTKDKYNHDKVLLGNDAGAADKESLYWHKVPGNAGRGNYVVVTYKKNNDDTIYSLQYNYIIKNGSEEEQDVVNGMFYLAQINNDGSYQKVENKNNFDNLSKLKEEINKMISTKEKLQEYYNSQNFINTLKDKIKVLQEKINSFENIEINIELQQLEKELQKTKAVLELINSEENISTQEEINNNEEGSPKKITLINTPILTNEEKLDLENNNLLDTLPLNSNIEDDFNITNSSPTEKEDTLKSSLIKDNITITDDEVPLANNNENTYDIDWWLIFSIIVFIIMIIIVSILCAKDMKDQSEE